jgi:hypothetical protein
MSIQYQACESTAQGDFQTTEHAYREDVSNGLEITRNFYPYLALGKGYQPLKSITYGI